MPQTSRALVISKLRNHKKNRELVISKLRNHKCTLERELGKRSHKRRGGLQRIALLFFVAAAALGSGWGK